MHADGEARAPVIGRHLLPARKVAELGCCCGGIDRERELLRSAARSGHGDRAVREPELPEQVAALRRCDLPNLSLDRSRSRAEPVAGAALDERHEALLRKRYPPREIAHVAKRSVRLALGDESVGIVLSHRLDVGEPDPDRLGTLC